MNIVLFEDSVAPRLAPLACCRPAYALSCGAFRLWDLLGEFAPSEFAIASRRGVVRPHLQAIQQQDFDSARAVHDTYQARRRPTLFLNARVVPDIDQVRMLLQWAGSREHGLLRQQGQLVAAVVPTADATFASGCERSDSEFLKHLEQLARQVASGGSDASQPPTQIGLFDYPHEIIRWHSQILCSNLRHRLATKRYQELAPGVHVGHAVSIHPQTAFDSSQGPIVVEEFARIGPFAVIEGPAWIGANAHIKPHAFLKRAVACGDSTRVGGEVEASVIESFSNKQHFGYLGHAYLGSWVNLGAGTSNSNLKNTYGKIRVDYPSGRVDTEMQFFGCVVGDYAKTAINTSIYTGKMIGCCSMVYGVATSNVPSFANFAPNFQQVTEVPAEVMIETQQRMFARRGMDQRPCDIQLLRDLFALAQAERQLVSKPLVL